MFPYFSLPIIPECDTVTERIYYKFRKIVCNQKNEQFVRT